MKSGRNTDLKDVVCRMDLIYDEIIDKIDVKYIPSRRLAIVLTPGLYEFSANHLVLKTSLRRGVKIGVTIEYIKLRSILSNNQTY